MKYTPKPADGERRALIGFIPQYKVAADLVYSALLEGTFEWIRIADPEAGRVDDIQIATHGRIDAYQVKWSEIVENISFNTLIRDEKVKDKVKPSLMRQLAEGWLRLKQSYPDRRVIVHLVHRHVPSPKARIPLDDSLPLKPNLQGFIEDCWIDKSWLRGGIGALPTGWQSALDTLKSATGLSEEEFTLFFQGCELHFQYKLPEQLETIRREIVQRIQDTEYLFSLLLEIAGDERRTIQLSKNDLLERLGWENRFRFKFHHEFWVDENLYQPISDTISELEHSISRFNNGYLALIGTPGSGKSTTLTQTFRYRKGFRIIRYYAYVRDDTRLGRGESLNFLHDLVLALRQQGVYGQTTSFAESREELLESLGSQLAELGSKLPHDGIRTLILVDGLDHIEREESPERSLLEDLPPPDAIPDGVLILLGTQKIDLTGLSPRIKAHLQECGRTLVMRSLGRRAVFSIIESAPIQLTLEHAQKEKIFLLSEGHPLALNYLLQKIQNCNNSDELDALLNESNPFRGNIEEDYKVYWDSLESDTEVRKLLGLISRIRGPIDLNLISEWVDEPVLASFIHKARHYFRIETDTRWHFLHNSFKQFLLEKTGRNLLGASDEVLHRRYHRQLAEFASKASSEEPWSWEEIYHRASAGDLDMVIELGSQERFRKQYFSLRSLEDILGDIGLCLKAAQQMRNGLAIIRGFLIESELRMRERNLGEMNLPKLLVELKGIDSAYNYVLRGQELRVPELEALKFCSLLISKGAIESAKKIFEASEPLDILSGSKGVKSSRQENINTVIAWARVAHFFRPLDRIMHIIDQLKPEISHQPADFNAEDEAEYIKSTVMYSLANSIFNSRDAEKLAKLKSLIKKSNNLEDLEIQLNFKTCIYREDRKTTFQSLKRIISWAEKNEIDDYNKTLIAELLFRIKKDASNAAKWIDTIKQPKIFDPLRDLYEFEELSPFIQRIRLNRLLSALGRPVDPVTAVPDANDENYRGIVLFERMIVLLANLWGRAWRGEIISPAELEREIYPAIILYKRSWDETRHWSAWYSIRRAAPDYFNLLIQSVATHGECALQELAKIFDTRWAHESNPLYWDTKWKRKISLELFRIDGSINALADRLSLIETEIEIKEEHNERLQDYYEQALTWLEVGKEQQASDLLRKMFETSFGIYGDEDDQFHLWVGWLRRAMLEQLEDADQHIRHFSGALVVLENSGRGMDRQDAARDLMETVATWNPDYALTLHEWLLDRRALHFTNSIEGFVKAAVKDIDAPIEIAGVLISNLLIPFQSSCHDDLAALFASQCYLYRDDNEAHTILKSLAHTIETKAFPTVRGRWWNSLLDGLRRTKKDVPWIKTKIEEIPKRDDKVSQPSLVLKSGETLTVDDAKHRVESFGELLNLINETEKENYFHWEEVLENIIDVLTAEQVKILQEKLKDLSHKKIFLSLLAKRLSYLGFSNQALEMAELALSQSSPAGWSRWYDGGTRLTAIKSLIEIDPNYARDKAYELLVNDYLSNIRNPTQMIRQLDELIPILFNEPPIVDIWKEIEQHIYQLTDFSQAKNLPPIPCEVRTKVPFSSMLIRLITSIFHISIPEIRQEAHKAMVQVILDGLDMPSLKKSIKELLAETEEYQIQALAILRVVSSYYKNFVSEFEDQIGNLCISPNMIVRNMAHELSDLSNIQPANITSDHGRLPITYQLELPEFPIPQTRIPVESLPVGETYPDTDDPLEMIRPFEPWFAKLSRLSGIPFQNLVIRAANLMKLISPQGDWNKEAEVKLKSFLAAADLKLTYNRLRPSVAFRAFAYVVAELEDAGILTESALSEINHEIIVHDPYLSIIEPIKRPQEIVAPKSDEMGFYPRKEWYLVGQEAFPFLIDRMDGGRLILGQLIRFINLDWEKPTEYRFSMVCHPHWPNPQKLRDAYDFFPFSTKWYGLKYPEMADASEWYSAVFYGKPHQIELGGMEWLAINPTIPLSLGWQFSQKGLFRWVDEKGNIMVESLKWQDGSIHRYPPRYHEVCSEGWLVVSSEEAAGSIAKKIGPSKILGAIVRLCDVKETNEQVHNFALKQYENEVFHIG